MSVELFFPTKGSQESFRVGPLGRDIDGFAAWLAAKGYAHRTAEYKLWLVRSLSRWLENEGLCIEDLNEERLEAFRLTGQAQGKAGGVVRTGRALLSFLRENGRIPAAPVDPGSDDPIDQIGRRYASFLVNERGLSSAAVQNYVPIVRSFLAERFGIRGVVLKDLVAQDANRYILRHSQRLSRTRTKLIATALRSFLRHLYQRGDIAVDLAWVILPMMNWRLVSLPKALPPEQVELLLESCDRETTVGRRDYAILLLLARLGLRANEVAVMTLDDLDWNKGVVSISGKSKRRDPLPLPHDVGEALAAYLRNGRPACSTRRLFVRIQAPHRGFSCSGAIRDVVRRSFERTGIDAPFKGSHVLRHSLATSMLGNGASLEEIGQVLRHRHPETTRIYAKLDNAALRTMAPAWPGGAS